MNELPITAAMDRRNGRLYLLMYLLIFLAAPVSYIGVVQAALCDKLGSNATIANLPSATYLLGGFAPFVLSLVIPHRWERAVVVWSNGLTAFLIGLVFLTLAAKLAPWIPLTVLIVQALLQGFTASTAQVFMFQCLARGTTLEGRNRTFQQTYFLSPISAVIGSLFAQFVLQGGLRRIGFPYDFALLYAVGFACMAGVTFLCSRFQLADVPDEPPPPLWQHITESVRDYARSRPLVLLFLVYTLWYCSLSITPNLALYTRHAMGRDPQDFSGWIMALRFGCKSLSGYMLGAIALRFGIRASVLVSSLLLALATVWGWVVPGYAFLFAFGLLGAGELGGAYIPNYAVSLSRPETTARNVALLTLASPLSSFSPALFGYLADSVGFGASFTFGLVMALGAMWLTLRIGEEKSAVVSEGVG
jgi:MFS family permease